MSKIVRIVFRDIFLVLIYISIPGLFLLIQAPGLYNNPVERLLVLLISIIGAIGLSVGKNDSRKNKANISEKETTISPEQHSQQSTEGEEIDGSQSHGDICDKAKDSYIEDVSLKGGGISEEYGHICIECGAKLNNDYEYCPLCGTRRKSSSSTQTLTARPFFGRGFFIWQEWCTIIYVT